MNYEKKYKEALANARQEYTTTENVERKQWLEELFPELKESEDERIRKRLIDLIYKVYAFTNYITCVEYENIIAWLEKQGDTTSDIRYDGVNAGASLSIVNGNSFDYEKATITQKNFASVGETATIELSSPIDCGDRIYHVSHKPIEKQGEQKPAVTDFNAKDWYVSKVDGKIHDMTYNPADKVEPKFKIGDYIVSDYCIGRVVEITSDAYLLDIGQGIPFSCEDKVHLWTIADAKDGDVLVDVYGNIGIFQKNDDFDWSSYCSLGSNGGFRCFAIEHELDRSHPATKEQRDTLEKAIADAGYTFDFEKKELKKPQRMISAEAKEALYDKVEPKFNIGDVLCDKSCTTLDKNSQPNIEILDIRAGMYICNNCSFPISQQDEYELVAKRIVPQSAAWSDEDENYLQSAENACEYQYGKNTSTILWLKSLKDRVQPQPKQEWSEEDKQEVEEFLKSLQQRFQPSLLTIVDWLKSLKNRMQK